MGDQDRIASLEQRLAGPPAAPAVTLEDLEMLADLYLQADSHMPALETIDRLLSLPAARGLSSARRAALELKAIHCRLAKGEPQAAAAQARELLKTLPAELADARVRAQLALAKALYKLGRIAESGTSAQQALADAEAMGDLGLCAQSLDILTVVAYREGDLSLARERGEEALVLCRRGGDEDNAINVRNTLSLVYKQYCEWESAIAHLEAALQSHRARGRLAASAIPLQNLGIVYQKMGEWSRAAEYYRACEDVLVQLGDDFHLALVDIGLGNVARLQRKFTDAETRLLSALERARRHGAHREEVLALEFLGELDFDRGRAERSLARYHEALGLAERTAPEADLIIELERRKSEALIAIGRLDEAELALDRATRLSRLTEDRLEQIGRASCR